MMPSRMSWLGEVAGMIAAASVKIRSLASVPRTTTYFVERNPTIATGPTRASKYGAWLTETVTYHH